MVLAICSGDGSIATSGGARIQMYLWRRRGAAEGEEPRRQPRAMNQWGYDALVSQFLTVELQGNGLVMG